LANLLAENPDASTQIEHEYARMDEFHEFLALYCSTANELLVAVFFSALIRVIRDCHDPINIIDINS